MKTIFSRAAAAAMVVLLPMTFTACDFSEVQNPLDDFDLIIELPPINTVVNGQIVDASTLEPINRPVTLTFEGAAASRLIDAYSDPIHQLKVSNGIVSFGIDNDLVPSPGNPVRFKVKATADGYFSSAQEVVLVSTGNGDFMIRLMRDTPAQQVDGTSSREDRSGTTSSEGVSSAVTVSTPAVTGTEAQAEVTVSQGTVPVTRSGQPLQGQLTVTVRVFDPGSGLAAMPAAAKKDASGKTLSLAGAVYVKIVDAQGNVAATFQGGNAAGKTAGVCQGGLTAQLKITKPSLVSAYQLLKQYDPNATVMADVWAYTPADQQNRRVGQVALEDGAHAGEVLATICVGGANASIDVSQLGDVSQGTVYSVSLQGGQVRTCKIDATVRIQNPNGFAVDVAQLALVGPGLNVQGLASFTAEPGTTVHQLADLLQEYDDVTVIDGATYEAAGFVQGQPVGLEIGNPCQGTYDVILPTVTTTQTYTINASLACPANQKFDVQLTEQSVDALSVSYKRRGTNEPYAFLQKSKVTRSVTASSITASAQLVLQPATSYTFKAVYGTDATNQEVSTPASGNTINLTFDPADAGLTCSAK